MATFEERHSTREAHESLFYERCWRCRCVVPNGLVRRRTMKTGSSRGTVLGTGAAVADLDHYEAVSLCGVCAEEIGAEEKVRLDREHREIMWFVRALGVVMGGVALSYAAVAPLVSTLSMIALARLRMVGRALLAMYAVAVLVKVETLPPDRYLSQFVLPWAFVTSGLALWRIWRAETLLCPFSWLVHKRSATVMVDTTPTESPRPSIGGKHT